MRIRCWASKTKEIGTSVIRSTLAMSKTGAREILVIAGNISSKAQLEILRG